jgi:Icc-related predicted phosphoesterase
MAKVVRIAALGDLHCSKSSQGTLQPLLAKAGESAELVVIAGDLTDYGLPDEARILARELTAVRVPVIAVLVNHDFESGKADEVRQILGEAGTTILDGDICETHGIGIAGVKGFGGGFGQRALAPWGETTIKQFVHEAVDEALRLETALARIGPMPIVALLHYSPIIQTVEASRWRFIRFDRAVSKSRSIRTGCLSHSHAHRGHLEGKTAIGVPVYNVSMQLLARCFPDHPPFRLFDIPLGPLNDEPREQPIASAAMSQA